MKKVSKLSSRDLEDLNSISKNLILDLQFFIEKYPKQQQHIFSRYLETRDLKHLRTLGKFKTNRPKLHHIIATFLSDNKFHSVEEIIKNCDPLGIELPPSKIPNFVTQIQRLRDRNNRFVLDIIHCIDDGLTYYRLNPEGTSSKFDGQTRATQRVFVIKTHNLILTQEEDAKDFCKSHKTNWEEMDLHRNLNNLKLG